MTLQRLGITLAGLGITICVFACAGAGAKPHKPHKPHRLGLRPRRAAPRKAHIETWAIDDGCSGGAGASSALVRQWVTYAESNCGPNAGKARMNCRAGTKVYCDVMQYLDTNWDFSNNSMRVAQAASGSWWLHEPSPNQGASVYSSTAGGGYLINQSNSTTRSFFRSYVRQHYNADDGLLMDWQSPSLPEELSYATCGCSTTSEIRSDAALRAAHEQMSAALTHANGHPFMQADNSLPPNPYLPQGLDLLSRSAGVDGLISEGEPENNGILDPYYSTLLDQIAYVATKTQSFVVPLSYGQAGAPSQPQSRRVQEATMLLGYSPGHLVDWANLEQGAGNLSVWPEEGLYPTDPVQSMQAPRGHGCLAGTGQVCSRGGHNSVRVAPGVYRREFRACYRAGAPIGPCAAVVNTTASWVTVRSSWLKRAYGHQITFIGGDVQSGGTIDLTGAPFAAGSTSVEPYDAMLIAR